MRKRVSNALKGEKRITIKFVNHDVHMNEEQQDKQDVVVIHLSWQVTWSVIRAPYLTPTVQVKIILSKKRKSNKSKSDYKVGKKKINRVQEW